MEVPCADDEEGWNAAGCMQTPCGILYGLGMYRFFVERSGIDMENGLCRITGKDVNHIGNVLRMRQGEQILLSTGEREDPVEYLCEIVEIRPDDVTARILDLQKHARELPLDLYLFQAVPKGDRFETVIEKSVELGVHGIVPVLSARCIVKLDEKRALKKTERWNALALSAAKQSKRAFVPAVERPVTWSGAMELARGMDRVLVPYENAEGISHTRDVIADLGRLCIPARGETADRRGDNGAGTENAVRRRPGSVGIFIGPEGGFEEREIDQLMELGAEVITLGHRILRTDTAGIAVLSMLMLHLEQD